MSVGVAIVTYNGAERVRHLLESLQTEREHIDQLVIAEDPCPYPHVHDILTQLAEKYDAQLVTGTTWGCMQGNAMRAIGAMRTDLVCLLSDDILVTPGCIRDVRYTWETWHQIVPIGLIQIPYWGNWSDMVACGFITGEDQFWLNWKKWIVDVPERDFWNYDGFPRMYVNVHGSGFAVNRKAWYAVNGVSQEHWSYDEDIAARLWVYTDYITITSPGRPFVHYGGASQCGNEHPDTDFHTLEAWKRGWQGMDKERVHQLIRGSMNEKAHWDAVFRMRIEGVTG